MVRELWVLVGQNFWRALLYFMYISLGHGRLSPRHDTLQYTLQHTLSPALNCLQL
jgi:hypothetical protein